MYSNIMNKLDEEISALDKKIASGQDLSSDEFECLDVWSHTMKSLQTVEAMNEYEEEDGGSSYGRSRNESWKRSGEGMYPMYRGVESRKRSMRMRSNRGSRNDGYSYHGGDDPMTMLQEEYDNAQTEQERKMIRRLMDKMD